MPLCLQVVIILQKYFIWGLLDFLPSKPLTWIVENFRNVFVSSIFMMFRTSPITEVSTRKIDVPFGRRFLWYFGSVLHILSCTHTSVPLYKWVRVVFQLSWNVSRCVFCSRRLIHYTMTFGWLIVYGGRLSALDSGMVVCTVSMSSAIDVTWVHKVVWYSFLFYFYLFFEFSNIFFVGKYLSN